MKKITLLIFSLCIGLSSFAIDLTITLTSIPTSTPVSDQIYICGTFNNWAVGDAAWETGSGPAEQKMKTRTLFLDAVSKFLTDKNIGGSLSMSMERFVKLSKIAMTTESRLDLSFNRLALIETSSTTHEWQGTGSFIEIYLESLYGVAAHVQKRDQTLTHFGLNREQLLALGKSLRGLGIDRLVPIGEALTFSSIWDGYDLCSMFSKKITF
jgi:hypothetical protein